MKTKILLVEDDTNMAFLLVDFLESNDFDVKLYRDGLSGLNSFKNNTFDFCILDVMLPSMDGFSIAKEIRRLDLKIPIIFLTARSIKEDRIKGLEIGVDDYITKPFDEEELLCRIKCILGRVEAYKLKDSCISSNFSIGKYNFNCSNRSLEINGNEKRLTGKENDVLKLLCSDYNNIVSRDKILLAVWGVSDYFTGRSLDVFITKLRKYLKDDELIKIENIPTAGYILKIQTAD